MIKGKSFWIVFCYESFIVFKLLILSTNCIIAQVVDASFLCVSTDDINAVLFIFIWLFYWSKICDFKDEIMDIISDILIIILDSWCERKSFLNINICCKKNSSMFMKLNSVFVLAVCLYCFTQRATWIYKWSLSSSCSRVRITHKFHISL